MSEYPPDFRASFTHGAMNTEFRIRLSGVEEELAGIARECWERLDALEASLSRYREDSEVSRIHALRAGETLYLSDACHRCLLAAWEGHAATGGLFDVTLGHRIDHLKLGRAGEPPLVEGSLMIHPDVAAVTCIEPGRLIDLGGIGKGFALDELRVLLADWGISAGLLSAGASSHLAFGPVEWPLVLAGRAGELRFGLREGSLSSSGTSIQGSHIVHPGSGPCGGAVALRHLWAGAPTATLAEIWSTALILSPVGDIPARAAAAGCVCDVFTEAEDGIPRRAFG
jgi:thiamine biosynthesis lipoprotein